MRIVVPVEVEDQRVSDLICSALEGGSNYWYLLVVSKSSHKEHGTFWSDIPMAGGHLGFALLDPDDGPINGKSEWVLNRASCESGLVIMANKYPRHYANFMNENDDAETGDVFLQCALFGELVFG